MTEHRHITVPEDCAGERLDKVLAALVSDLSRARLQALIREGCVTVDGRGVTDAKTRAVAGASIVVAVPAPEPALPQAQALPLKVVYEDDALIVIDKPAGLVVHPGAGHADGTLVNALIAHCGDSLSGIGGVRRPGIVHRLDRDTSGLLVVAKTDAAHHGLSEQFAAHGADGRMSRRYRALAWGTLTRPAGFIDAPLARSTTHRTRMAVVGEDRGRHAVTHYRVTATYAGGAVSDLDLELETGRTHQIRVHMAHIRHPLLGDPVYGAGFKTRAAHLNEAAAAALAALGRQALHAAHLGFEHPLTGQAMAFDAELPEDLARLVTALKNGS